MMGDLVVFATGKKLEIAGYRDGKLTWAVNFFFQSRRWWSLSERVGLSITKSAFKWEVTFSEKCLQGYFHPAGPRHRELGGAFTRKLL